MNKADTCEEDQIYDCNVLRAFAVYCEHLTQQFLQTYI